MKSEIYEPQRGFKRLRIRFDADVCRADVARRLESAIPRALPQPTCQKLELILGVGARAEVRQYASNVLLMGKLSKAIGEAWSREWVFNSERQLQLLTITPPAWWVSETCPILDLRQWRSEASRWLKRLKFTGMAIIEPAPFYNVEHPLGGRSISFHIHAIGYSEYPSTYVNAVLDLAAHLKPGSPTTLPAVVSKPVDGTPSDVRYTTEYTAKVASGCKKSTPATGQREGEDLLRNGPMPGQLGLRVQEMMSYFKLQEIIITRGTSGRLCKKEALQRVGPDAIVRYPNRMSGSQLAPFWRRMWSEYRAAVESERKRRRCEAYSTVCVIR